jgi:hypothetical protein
MVNAMANEPVAPKVIKRMVTSSYYDDGVSAFGIPLDGVLAGAGSEGALVVSRCGKSEQGGSFMADLQVEEVEAGKRIAEALVGRTRQGR